MPAPAVHVQGKHDGGPSVAVPPPASGFGGERPRSNSAVILSTRLRAASEMQRQGVISAEEKAVIKQLILQSDPTFREQFDQARKTGDLTTIKRLLLSQPSRSDQMLQLDMTEMTLGDVDELYSDFLSDLGGSEAASSSSAAAASGGAARPPPGAGHQHRGSMGFGSEFANMAKMHQAQQLDLYGRKRQNSRSAVPQGMNKALAGPGGSHVYAQQVPLPPPAAPLAGGAGAGAGAAAAVGGVAILRAPAAAALPGGAAMHSQRRSSGFALPAAAAPAQQQPPPQQQQQQQQQPLQMQMLKAEEHFAMGIREPQPFLRISSANSDGDDGGDDLDGEGEDDEATGIAKSRKNERERMRRLAVTNGFDDLYKVLKRIEEERAAAGDKEIGGVSISATSKLDKASILRSGVEKIRGLELLALQLFKENERMHAQLQQHHAK